MIKQAAVVLMAGAMAMTAFADNDVGCGAGTILWAGQEGIVPKVLAATTNGSFGNQTFGITTGTLGCSPNGRISSRVRLTEFTGANMDRLAYDMSVGRGETLDTLADMMQIPASLKPHFFALTQSHFDQLFPNTQQNAGAVVDRLEAILKSDSSLSTFAS